MGSPEANPDASPGSTPVPGRKIKAMRIATRCATADEFVAGFHGFCDETSCFIPTLGMRPVGLEIAFAIELTDGTPVLRGLCVILDAWPTADNQFKRPGLRVGVRRLTTDTTAMFERIQAARAVAAAAVAVAIAPVRDNDTAPIDIPVPRRTDEFEAPTMENAAMAPPPEARAPGSSFVLPANPLTALTDESLSAFVDCNVYEELGEDTPAPTSIDELAAGPSEVPLAPVVPEPSAIARLLEAPSARPVMATLLGVAPLVAPPVQQPMRPLPTDRPLVVARPVDHENADPGPTRWRWGVIAGIAIAALVIAALVWAVAIRSRSSVPAATPPTPRVEATAVPAPIAPSAPVAVEPVVPAKPPVTPEEPSVGQGPCQLVVTSTPIASTVLVDKKLVGKTPISIDGPCQPHTVEISHERYETRVVTTIADHPKPIDVTLTRPKHTLKISSSPAGATIAMNGRRAGTTPATLDVMGFSSMTLTIAKPGYRTITKKLYSTKPDDTMTFDLVR